MAGGPEEVWAELHATALDLGVPWPAGRSPREIRNHLVQHLGAPVGPDTAERPEHGPTVAPEAVTALDRIVGCVERLRYARVPERAQPLRAELQTCLASLHGGATRSARRRAEWWPRSVVSSSRRSVYARASRPVQARYGEVVDHVG